jgi:hypothetical protein
MLYTVDKSDMPLQLLQSVLSPPLIYRYNDQLLSLRRQFLLIPNRVSLWISAWIFLRHALINSAGIWSIPGTWCLLLFSSHLKLRHTWLRHWWFCCMYFCLPNIINPRYNQQLREIVPPPRQNIVGVQFGYSFSLSLKCTLASSRTLFRLSALLWFVSCHHCILPCFLWSKRQKILQQTMF